MTSTMRLSREELEARRPKDKDSLVIHDHNTEMGNVGWILVNGRYLSNGEVEDLESKLALYEKSGCDLVVCNLPQRCGTVQELEAQVTQLKEDFEGTLKISGENADNAERWESRAEAAETQVAQFKEQLEKARFENAVHKQKAESAEKQVAQLRDDVKALGEMILVTKKMLESDQPPVDRVRELLGKESRLRAAQKWLESEKKRCSDFYDTDEEKEASEDWSRLIKLEKSLSVGCVDGEKGEKQR